MENNLKPEDIKQEFCRVKIKEEVSFELIEEQICIDEIKEEIKEEKDCFDLTHVQSLEESVLVNQIKKEDLNNTDENNDNEFIKEEEEIDYVWPEVDIKETDPLALPEIKYFLTMENNLKPEDIKQECCKVIIKEEVFFELIEEQACIGGIEEESGVINIIKEEKGYLDEKHDQRFTFHILKEENISVNQIKKEDLNTIDVNKYEEFIKEEEEFDYIWPEDALKETDPLALPEIKCENEFPNTEEASVSLCESSNTKDAECKFTSSTCSHLKRHMAKHMGERPYKFTLCEFASSTSSNLKVHMAKHSGERPYKCTLCEFASSTSSCLKVHMSKHTGERPYCPREIRSHLRSGLFKNLQALRSRCTRHSALTFTVANI